MDGNINLVELWHPRVDAPANLLLWRSLALASTPTTTPTAPTSAPSSATFCS